MRAFLTSALVILSACGDTTIFDPMERQPKLKAFSASPLFDDGRGMRPPPAGTVPRERQTERPEITTGLDKDGKAVPRIPIAITHELMNLGRKKFEIHCAVCHGLLGDGKSLVATQMSLKPPPNLHRLKNGTPSHVFQVVSQGFGLMASYAAELDSQERWAVVAYLQALQRSQAGALAEAPADIQQKLREEAAP